MFKTSEGGIILPIALLLKSSNQSYTSESFLDPDMPDRREGITWEHEKKEELLVFLL